MDRGFRTGIAHFDAYCVDAWVLAAGKDRQACRLNYCFVYAAASHGVSVDLVLWYMVCIYVLYHEYKVLKNQAFSDGILAYYPAS